MSIRSVGRGWLKNLCGGVATYVLVAACAGNSGMSVADGGAATDAGHVVGAHRSEAGSDAAREAASPLDAFMRPVPDALASSDAAPSGPTVATEACDQTYKFDGTGVAYAEHLFPGKTTQQLAFVAAYYPGVAGPPGYTALMSQGTYLRDGAVAVLCSTGITSVTFVLP